MDGTTEPIIVIMGHPIAGNPSQLAIERSLTSLGLEWRVLSFDVAPQDVAKALDGFSVTGIVGVLLGPNVQAAGAAWYQASSDPEVSPPPTCIDCLHRDPEGALVGSFQKRLWTEDLLASYRIQDTLWMGEAPDEASREQLPMAGLLEKALLKGALLKGALPDAPAPDDLEIENQDPGNQKNDADLMILSDLTDSDEECDLLESDRPVIVFDLTDGHPCVPEAVSRGYKVVSNLEVQVGTLQRCLTQWTSGSEVSRETIAEAIEEYLGV